MFEQLERIVYVSCPLGLHVRPAAKIVRLLQDSTSKVHLYTEKGIANAGSLIEILMLEAAEGTELRITAEGEDAGDVMERLVTAFDSGFED